MEEEKKEEKKEEKEEEKKEGKSLGIWKIIGAIVLVGIVGLVVFGISHYRKLSRDLENLISLNKLSQEELVKEEEAEEVTPTEVEEEEAVPAEVEEEEEALDEAFIKAAVLERVGLEEEEVEFTITTNTGTHAKGNIREVEAVGGGYWLAAKAEGEWVAVYDGQAHPTCEEIEPYDFPTDLVEECLDDEGNVVTR